MRRRSVCVVRGMRRIAPAVSLAALSLSASGSSAVASETIGQTGIAGGTCAANIDRLVQTTSSGNSYVVPATGGIGAWTVTSWSHPAVANASQTLTMKVFRPIGGTTYMAVGHDSRSLAAGVLNTFPTSLAVKTGDVLGLYTDTDNIGCLFTGAPGNLFFSRMGNLADGASDSFFPAMTNGRTNISAVLNPTNSFTLGGTTRNKKKGTATIIANVPNPGELTASGKGVNAAGVATISKTVSPGATTLLIKATGKKKRKLKMKGKVNLGVVLAYTPTGGDTSTQATNVKLKRKPKKKR
jgi:hypothetical protein